MSYYYDGFYKKETIAEKRARNKRALVNFKKIYPNIEISPIIVLGNKIAKSFWGNAWCNNLSYYADYDNRIGRGKSYLKEGAVFDISIKSGEIIGIIAGSQVKPYYVTINIKPMQTDKLIKKINGNIKGFEELTIGEFPKEMSEVFLTQENGLFPKTEEISFDCTCPDSAKMCKHVSAVLFGVGAKLDLDPLLIFELREIDTKELIQKTAEEKVELMLKNADKTESKRILNFEEVEDLFNL